MPRNNQKRNLFRLLLASLSPVIQNVCWRGWNDVRHLLLQYKHVPNIPVKQEPIRPKIWHMFLQGRGCVGVVYFHVLLNMLGWYFIKGCVQQLNNHAVLNNKNPMPSVSIWPTNNGTKMNRSNTEPRLNLEKIYAHHCANRTCASLIRQTRNGKNTWIAVFVQAPC